MIFAFILRLLMLLLRFVFARLAAAVLAARGLCLTGGSEAGNVCQRFLEGTVSAHRHGQRTCVVMSVLGKFCDHPTLEYEPVETLLQLSKQFVVRLLINAVKIPTYGKRSIKSTTLAPLSLLTVGFLRKLLGPLDNMSKQKQPLESAATPAAVQVCISSTISL